MNTSQSRRQFLKQSAFAAGALALASDNLVGAPAGPKRTATDLVPLGRTGLKLSRLAMGTGSNNGHIQAALGREGFTKLVHYAYDHGIRAFDCAESYATFPWLATPSKVSRARISSSSPKLITRPRTSWPPWTTIARCLRLIMWTACSSIA